MMVRRPGPVNSPSVKMDIDLADWSVDADTLLQTDRSPLSSSVSHGMPLEPMTKTTKLVDRITPLCDSPLNQVMERTMVS